MTKRIEHCMVHGTECKRCSACHQWLPLESYCRDAQCWDGLHRYCRGCLSQRNKAEREAHPSRVQRSAAEWYKRNALGHKERSKAWRRDHLREARAIERAYYRTHREVSRAIGHRRRARLRGASGAEYTTQEAIQARWRLYGGKCWICGRDAEAMDHVKPLAKGGGHWPCNLRPVCRGCNSSKGDTWPYTCTKLQQRLGARDGKTEDQVLS